MKLLRLGNKAEWNLQEIGMFSSFIKPKYFKKLFSVVKQKTKITQEQINSADSFRNVIKQFIRWIGDDYLLISWGHDDVLNLILNCKFNRIKIDWLKRNIDIQNSFQQFIICRRVKDTALKMLWPWLELK